MKTSEYPYPKAVRRFPTLRQSLLSSFDNCGLTTKFDIDYRRGWSTAPQSRGQLFHKVAGQCMRAMHAAHEESIPVDAALAILHDVLRQDDADRVCPWCKGEDIKPGVSPRGLRTCGSCGKKFETDLVNVSLEQVKDLYWVTIKWANENSWDIQNIVMVERRVEAELRYPHRGTGEMCPRKLTGQMDVVFLEGGDPAHLTVVDYKDMWSVPPPKEISDEGYFQQRMYGWLLFRNFPSVETVTLREQYVRYTQTREARMGREQADSAEAELAALVERFDRAFEENTWVPTSGRHCNFCVRPSACPIPTFARDEGRITDMRRATSIAHQLLVGQKVVKDARAALRAFADKNGPVPVRDAKGPRLMGYVDVMRNEKPSLEDIEREERRIGRPLTSSEVKALYRRVPGTRFQEYVPGPKEQDDGAVDDAIMATLEQAVEHARSKSDAKQVADDDEVPF